MVETKLKPEILIPEILLLTILLSFIFWTEKYIVWQARDCLTLLINSVVMQILNLHSVLDYQQLCILLL